MLQQQHELQCHDYWVHNDIVMTLYAVSTHSAARDHLLCLSLCAAVSLCLSLHTSATQHTTCSQPSTQMFSLRVVTQHVRILSQCAHDKDNSHNIIMRTRNRIASTRACSPLARAQSDPARPRGRPVPTIVIFRQGEMPTSNARLRKLIDELSSLILM